MKRTLLTLGLILSLTACGEGYSVGDRVGTVTKLSYKGLFCKSWEGTMAMQSFTRQNAGTSKNPNYVMTNAFDFSVTDPEIVQELKSAMDDGASV